MRSRVVWAAAFLSTSLAAASSSAQFSTDTCTANSVGQPCTYGTCVPGVCDAQYEDGGSFHGSCVLCAALPGLYCPAANVGQDCGYCLSADGQECQDGGLCSCIDAGVCLTGASAGGGGASASPDGGAPSSYFSESYTETYCGRPGSEDGGAGPASDAGLLPTLDSSIAFPEDAGVTVTEPVDAHAGDAFTAPVTSAEAGSNPFSAWTDTCTSNSVGQACSFGTCVPGQCTSSDSDGNNFNGACVICVSLLGPYCPAADVGQACKGGGVCTASSGDSGGGSASSTSGGGWSTMSVSYTMSWCSDGMTSSGGSGSGSGGFSSSGASGSSGSSSGGPTWSGTSGSSGSSGGSSGSSSGSFAGSSTSGGASSTGGSSGIVGGSGSSTSSSSGSSNGSSNGVVTSSGSGSGGQGGTPRSDDAGSGEGKGGTVASDAGSAGTSSGGGQAAATSDAGAAGSADNGGDRETATGLACSVSKGTAGSSRLGFLALVGLAVAVWRRRRSD